jgi:hypothetical protein
MTFVAESCALRPGRPPRFLAQGELLQKH